MLRLQRGLMLFGAALMFACGCSGSPSGQPKVVRREPVQREHKEESLQAHVHRNGQPKTVVMNNGVDLSKPVAGVPSDLIKPSTPGNAADAAVDADDPDAQISPDQYRARRRIAGEIAEALKIRKTLVVWLIDKSSSSADVRNWAVGRLSRISHEATKLAGDSGKPAAPLSMAIVAYGSKVEFLNEELVDPSQAESLAGALPSETVDSPLTFTAVDQAADKFLKYRSKGYEMLFVIVADTTGQDWDRLDAAIPKLRRKSVPVFGVGNAVPFFRSWHAEQLGGGPPANLNLESCQLESVDHRSAGESKRARFERLGLRTVGLGTLVPRDARRVPPLPQRFDQHGLADRWRRHREPRNASPLRP